MTKTWIGTNWKMTKTTHQGLSYCRQLIEISRVLNPQLELFIIPSYTSLWPIKNLLLDSNILLGAQNMHWKNEGAFTGEISPLMLKEIGIDIVELGHSERRQYYNENDKDINKKVHAAIHHQLEPLICIGETLDQKQEGRSFEVVKQQLFTCLENVSSDHATHLLIAYEPVWAIGEKGIAADQKYVRLMLIHIRSVLRNLFGKTGIDVPILYGGSVNKNNFLHYLHLEEVNGLFIGRAAWDIDSFKEILKEIDVLIRKGELS